jgi:hypothetical protein
MQVNNVSRCSHITFEGKIRSGVTSTYLAGRPERNRQTPLLMLTLVGALL